MFTSVAGFEDHVDAIPDDIPSVAAAVQGLVLHDAWAPAYGVTPAPERLAEKELHSAVAMLNRATSLDTRPLTEPRLAEHRAVGVCRHFATLFVAILRRKGIPARVRCGFASYFEADKNGDHWVGEYWSHEEQRWVLVDEQLDEPQRNVVKPDFDTLDVPRDRFIVAGEAWRRRRRGAADPLTFDVGSENLWGLEEVMGQVFQDLAALQKVELLPWDWYGLAKEDGAWERDLELIDRLASLSIAGGPQALDQLRDIAAADARVAVPTERVNATLDAEMAGRN